MKVEFILSHNSLKEPSQGKNVQVKLYVMSAAWRKKKLLVHNLRELLRYHILLTSSLLILQINYTQVPGKDAFLPNFKRRGLSINIF